VKKFLATLVVAMVAAVAAVAASAAPASATIHALMVGWVCGSTSGEPPGQTPDETHSDQSTFRALQATGIIIGIDPETGLPIFDYDNPAIKFSSFTVVPEETGTPSNPGAINCVKGIFTTTT
jgi:opacity protein-like surface antigen